MLNDLPVTTIELDASTMCETDMEVLGSLMCNSPAQKHVQALVNDFNQTNQTRISISTLLKLARGKNTTLGNTTTALHYAHFLHEIHNKVQIAIGKDRAPIPLSSKPKNLAVLMQQGCADQMPVQLLLRACQKLIEETTANVGSILASDLHTMKSDTEETVGGNILTMLDTCTTYELSRYIWVLHLKDKLIVMRQLLLAFKKAHHRHTSIGRYWKKVLAAEMNGCRGDPVIFFTKPQNTGALIAALDHCKDICKEFPRIPEKKAPLDEVKRTFVEDNGFAWLEFETPVLLEFIGNDLRVCERKKILLKLIATFTHSTVKNGTYLMDEVNVSPTCCSYVTLGQWNANEWAKIIYHFRRLRQAQLRNGANAETHRVNERA